MQGSLRVPSSLQFLNGLFYRIIYEDNKNTYNDGVPKTEAKVYNITVMYANSCRLSLYVNYRFFVYKQNVCSVKDL